MDQHIVSVINALTFIPARHASTQTTYQLVTSGPLLSHTYQNQLARAIFAFLTPGQATATIHILFATLRDAWSKCSGEPSSTCEDGSPASHKSKKKRKIDLDAVPVDPQHACAFALLCRLASTVLTSLPVSTLPPATLSDVQSCIRDIKTTILIPTVQWSHRRGVSDEDLWATQVVGAAALRTLSSLQVASTTWLGPDGIAEAQEEVMEKTGRKLLRMMKSPDNLPEFTLEIVGS